MKQVSTPSEDPNKVKTKINEINSLITKYRAKLTQMFVSFVSSVSEGMKRESKSNKNSRGAARKKRRRRSQNQGPQASQEYKYSVQNSMIRHRMSHLVGFMSPFSKPIPYKIDDVDPLTIDVLIHLMPFACDRSTWINLESGDTVSLAEEIFYFYDYVSVSLITQSDGR